MWHARRGLSLLVLFRSDGRAVDFGECSVSEGGFALCEGVGEGVWGEMVGGCCRRL